MNRLVFSPILGSYFLILLIVVLLGCAVVWFVPTGDRLTDRGRKIILALRLFSLFLFALLMLRPTLVYTETRQLPAALYLLLDSSESMSVRDGVGGKSRFEIARQSLQDCEKSLQKMQKRFDVHPFYFDQELHSLEMSRGVVNIHDKPEGKETAIGFALDEVFQRAAGKRILATILLSDGTQRAGSTRDMTPRDAAVKFRDANFPLYTVAFGKPGVPDNLDIAVREIIAPNHIFVKNELVVSGQVRVNGYVNQQIPIKLHFETSPGRMEVVETKSLSATEEGQLVNYRFHYIPDSTGLKKVTVEVPVQDKEVVKTNNEMSSFVRVLEGGLNVLYLEGSSMPEQRVLRESIDSSEDIHLQYVRFRVQETIALAKRQTQAVGKTPLEILQQQTELRESLVKDYFMPDQFTVYMIGNLDAAAFKREELQALANLVKTNGAGLIMLGGLHSFGAGGYAQTPLADVLPVVMLPEDRQPPGEMPRTDVHWEGAVAMKPTDIGLRQNPFLLGLSANTQQTRKLWDELPPLNGANRLIEKRTAIVLAAGPQGTKQPLLVQQLSGAGRVLAFAGDSTWRWWYDHEREHKRFWRQVILWLAKMDESMLGDCWIELPKPRFSPGETVQFRVHLKNDKGEEIRSPKVNAMVQYPDGRHEQAVIVDENGVATGSIRNATTAGDYTIRATASPRDAGNLGPQASSLQGAGKMPANPGQATARFIVFDQNLELDNPVADPTLLGSIAELTGGKSVPPESLPALLEELEEKAELLTEKRETKRSLYDSWPMLILLCTSFALEWFLRKRFGLV